MLLIPMLCSIGREYCHDIYLPSVSPVRRRTFLLSTANDVTQSKLD